MTTDACLARARAKLERAARRVTARKEEPWTERRAARFRQACGTLVAAALQWTKAEERVQKRGER